jgi:hypothetical protein
MQRRSFLKAVAAVAPAADLQEFLVAQARAQTPASPPTNTLHPFGAGEDRFGHPLRLGSVPFSSMCRPVSRERLALNASRQNMRSGLYVIVSVSNQARVTEIPSFS